MVTEPEITLVVPTASLGTVNFASCSRTVKLASLFAGTSTYLIPEAEEAPFPAPAAVVVEATAVGAAAGIWVLAAGVAGCGDAQAANNPAKTGMIIHHIFLLYFIFSSPSNPIYISISVIFVSSFKFNFTERTMPWIIPV